MAIHKFAQLILQGRPVPMFGDGSMRRDFTYVGDIVDGVVRSLDRAQGCRIYNLGESRTVSLSELSARSRRRSDARRRSSACPRCPATCR